MHAVIVANAPDFDATPFKALLAQTKLLIAADGGANALWRANVAPRLVVGDLDSLDDAALAWVGEQGAEVVRLPREKDETDLEVALLLALMRGATRVDVLGALGGRLDHTLANVAMLGMPELVGYPVRLLDANQELFVVRPGEVQRLMGASGETVSLLPLSGAVRGITITGFYYPLNNAALRADRARGVSNVLLEAQATITVGDGLLLVVHHFDDGAHQWRHGTPNKGKS